MMLYDEFYYSGILQKTVDSPDIEHDVKSRISRLLTDSRTVFFLPSMVRHNGVGSGICMNWVDLLRQQLDEDR